MTSDINAMAGEALKTINNGLPNILSANEISPNRAIIFVLAITLLVMYMALVLTVGVPFNQGYEVVNPDYLFIIVDDDTSPSEIEQEISEQLEMYHPD
ncbi:Uncharacterized protein PCOAH_00047550 [Plasmodium coatneyi]|uniref:Uncharacterized protein n=1 Tax=Plasmodium coatneyi TaxID=208452 RepID=A0A1B1E4Y7_9APIC|nr:Uncharacterized protein PCOAH_00047550 [Plasmodium coatneyi]ANQ10066.1 Uncharacterized protein PCOAH_00047550 [Plasmodium coatneyi]